MIWGFGGFERGGSRRGLNGELVWAHMDIVIFILYSLDSFFRPIEKEN